MLEKRLPKHTPLTRSGWPSFPANGEIVTVRNRDGSEYRGYMAGYATVEGGERSACVIPLTEPPRNFSGMDMHEFGQFSRGLPAEFVLSDGQRILIRNSGQSESRFTLEDLEQFMSERRSSSPPRARKLRPSKLRSLNPKGVVGVGARVTVCGMPGEWLVISLAPGSGNLHVQSDETGELATTNRRECEFVGDAVT